MYLVVPRQEALKWWRRHRGAQHISIGATGAKTWLTCKALLKSLARKGLSLGDKEIKFRVLMVCIRIKFLPSSFQGGVNGHTSPPW